MRSTTGGEDAVATEATVAAEVVAEAATKESGTPGEMVEAAIVNAARAPAYKGRGGKYGCTMGSRNCGRGVDAGWGHGGSPRTET